MTVADTCRSCGAAIVWAYTAGGKRMPVDAEVSRGANLVLFLEGGEWQVRVAPIGHGKHRPHFATCPDADSWRKRA